MSKTSDLSLVLDELRKCGETMISISESLREIFSAPVPAEEPEPEKPKEKTKAKKEESKPISFEELRAVMARKTRVTNTIRTLRFMAGEMTQQQLADRVGVSRQTIIALEAGKYLPSLPLAFRLAKTFGVRIEDVFEMQDPESETPA